MNIQVAPRHQINFQKAVQLSTMSVGESMGVIFAKGNRILYGVSVAEYLTIRDPLYSILVSAPIYVPGHTLYVARQLNGVIQPSRPKDTTLELMQKWGIYKAVIFYTEAHNLVRQKL